MIAKTAVSGLISLVVGASLIGFFFVPAFRGDIAVTSGFYIGPLYLHSYGLLAAVAILACFVVAKRLSPILGFTIAEIENLLPWLLIFGFIGARLYFIFFSWDYFRENSSEIIKIWHGGLSIYGGIIGAALGLFIYAKKNSLPAGKLFDLVAATLPLGQALGRFGNFFNEEAFGQPTNLAWKLYISPAHRPAQLLTERYYHPTFLYEALWDMLVFVILWKLFKVMTPTSPPPHEGEEGTRSRSGFLFGIYLILYSMGRFFIEALRLDSFYWHGLRIDQITALVMISIGLSIVIQAREKMSDA